MKALIGIVLATVLLFSTSYGAEKDLAQNLQDVSVTIKSSNGEGSGVIVTRKIDNENYNFVWTAAHVVEDLRSTRSVIDPVTGSNKTLIEFRDASIVKELTEDGRRVGEFKMDAKVIRYSDADHGEDLAVLLVRKKDFINKSSAFSNERIVPVGTELWHVGSLLGQQGANSMTRGIMSQIGRVHDNVVYDQTTVTAFPGSSGGGVFDGQGKYVGMLVRGSGETFNLIVPLRRMKSWAENCGVLFIMDETAKTPTIKELLSAPIETQSSPAVNLSEKKKRNTLFYTGTKEF